MAETYDVPMFYGFKTRTDNQEFYEYMKKLVECTSRREGNRMSRELNQHFPGLQLALVEAVKDLYGLSKEQPTQAIHEDGKVMVKGAKCKSDWHSTQDYVEAEKVRYGTQSEACSMTNWLIGREGSNIPQESEIKPVLRAEFTECPEDVLEEAVLLTKDFIASLQAEEAQKREDMTKKIILEPGMYTAQLLGAKLYTDVKELADYLNKELRPGTSPQQAKDIDKEFPGLLPSVISARFELEADRFVVDSILHRKGRIQASAGPNYMCMASDWVAI